MLPRPTNQIVSRSDLCEDSSKVRVEVAKMQPRERSESRVSTDSDLDLESEDDYDGYVDGDDDCRNSFPADLLVHKLEQVQQQNQKQASWGARDAPSASLFELAEESYREKMRRISQWRESTHQSETSSDYSPLEPETESVPAFPSRKRRLSDASLPTSSKRARSVPSPRTPGSPLFSYPRAYSFGLPSDGASDLGVQPRLYIRLLTCEALHVCTACDATFSSRQHLRRHGRSAPDACRAAVTYVLE